MSEIASHTKSAIAIGMIVSAFFAFKYWLMYQKLFKPMSKHANLTIRA
jgi:uncharacterized protein with PQ loop repeat